MGGILLLSPQEELYLNDNILLVRYRPRKQVFDFEHRTVTRNDDAKEAQIPEAWLTLRLFLGYKFGIPLPRERPNHLLVTHAVPPSP